MWKRGRQVSENNWINLGNEDLEIFGSQRSHRQTIAGVRERARTLVGTDGEGSGCLEVREFDRRWNDVVP